MSHRGWLLGVLLVGPFMAQADATIANVATPSIHTDLGASGAVLELVIGGYLNVEHRVHTCGIGVAGAAHAVKASWFHAATRSRPG